MTKRSLNLGFLASHNGTDMQGIVAAIESGEVQAEVKLVISNNRDSKALSFAKDKNISNIHISELICGTSEDVDRVIRDSLISAGVDLVILSGYMKKVGPLTRGAYPERILNVHPSLLPRYAGLWGDAVHKAVLASGDKITGVTIHTIDEEYDKGKIILQTEVNVEPDDTLEDLRVKVQAEEIQCFIAVLRDIQSGHLSL